MWETDIIKLVEEMKRLGKLKAGDTLRIPYIGEFKPYDSCGGYWWFDIPVW